ncbi:MAG: hypothetical protein DCC70_08235 [Burkholderiales bacterium]|nr:MAG: hypothetical protein EDM78_04115 [Pseudomonadota bacterium]RIK89402.1 MAG: hypothetical protein DCC70_08235 [Burkholderiales bacterium]
MWKVAPRNKGVRLAGKDALGCSVVEQPKGDVPSLADLGIDRKVAMVARRGRERYPEPRLDTFWTVGRAG